MSNLTAHNYRIKNKTFATACLLTGMTSKMTAMAPTPRCLPSLVKPQQRTPTSWCLVCSKTAL